MTINWFPIFIRQDFIDTGLVSQELSLDFGDLGTQSLLVTKGNLIGVLYNEVFLCLELNGENPMSFEDQLLWVDDDDQVWLGIPA